MSFRNGKARRRFANLEAWRKAQGFTLEQAAESLSVPLATYYHWERGDRRPKAAAMRALVARTGVDLSVLAGVA